MALQIQLTSYNSILFLQRLQMAYSSSPLSISVISGPSEHTTHPHISNMGAHRGDLHVLVSGLVQTLVVGFSCSIRLVILVSGPIDGALFVDDSFWFLIVRILRPIRLFWVRWLRRSVCVLNFVNTMVVGGTIQLRKIVGPIVLVPDDCDQPQERLYRWWR